MLKNILNDKKKLGLFIVIAVIILIVVIVTLVSLFGSEGMLGAVKNPDGEKFENEYEKLNSEVTESGKKYPKVSIPSDNTIKYATVEDILKIFDDAGDGVVYFGYSTCLYCRNAIQVLVDTAHETELDIIYYIDIEEVWDVLELDSNNKVITKKEADDKYYDLLEVLGDELVTDYTLEDSNGKSISTGKKRLEVPLVIFITNGKVSSYNKGTLFSQEDPYTELDTDQKRGLSEIYGYGIRDVVDSKKNKGLLKK